MWLRWRNVGKKSFSLSPPWRPLGSLSTYLRIISQEYWSGLSCPLPGGSSWPRDWTLISCAFCIAGIFFTTKPPGKPTATDTALVKKKWYLQERMKPDLRGFFQITGVCGFLHAEALAWEPCGAGSSTPTSSPWITGESLGTNCLSWTGSWWSSLIAEPPP